MHLYIIRHADPDYAHNTITPKGWEEAKALVPAIEYINPTHIYCSPLGRAQDTAKPYLEKHGRTFEVLDWTAESMAYMQEPPYGSECGHFAFDYSKGFYDCVDFSHEDDRDNKLPELVKGSDALLAKHGFVREGGVYKVTEDNHDKVCVFCHGGFGSAWIAYLLGLSPMYGWHHIKLETTSVTLFKLRANANGYAVPVCSYLNDIQHKIDAGLCEKKYW